MLVDELTTAPHVDRMMKLLSNMNQVKGQALPPTVPGEGPGRTEYFQLKRQLKSVPPHPVKTTFAPKKIMTCLAPTTIQKKTTPSPLPGNSRQR